MSEDSEDPRQMTPEQLIECVSYLQNANRGLQNANRGLENENRALVCVHNIFYI